jgi:2,3-bisphosphoglycerate-dependent phosphoglycerate mutase
MSSVFYLLRHGLTDDDTPGREKVTGWLDVPLNEQGRRNAARAGRFLKRKGITHIISSDLERTCQTAEIVSDITGLKVADSDKLRSWNMGAMQGVEVETAKPFLSFFEKKPSVRPPDGEPFQNFYNRFKGAFYATVSHVKKFPALKPLIVTHSQNMDIVDWFLKDIPPGRALEFGEGIPPGGIMEVRIDDEGKISARKVRVD